MQKEVVEFWTLFKWETFFPIITNFTLLWTDNN
jgi:hypothetical protein